MGPPGKGIPRLRGGRWRVGSRVVRARRDTARLATLTPQTRGPVSRVTPDTREPWSASKGWASRRDAAVYFPVSGWFAAFVLTCTVEVPVVAALLRPSGADLGRVVPLVVFANLATHPLVWYVIPQLLLLGTPEHLFAAETWAVAAEAVFYGLTIRGLAWRRAIAVSLSANVSSFLAGQLVGAAWPALFE